MGLKGACIRLARPAIIEVNSPEGTANRHGRKSIISIFKRPDADIYFEVKGSGPPLLLFGPGGLQSRIDRWHAAPASPGGPRPRIDPTVDLTGRFTVIAMDQRNAGQSRAKVASSDGWHTYAADHLALMDHLGHRRFLVMGACIGGSFDLKLCQVAPERIAAAVLMNPIGLHENRETWDAGIRNYDDIVRRRDPTISKETIQSFGNNMFGGDFVFSVDRDFVRRCPTPLFLMPGNDTPHPAATSAEIASLVPHIEIHQDWDGPANRDESIRRVSDFLGRHAP